MSTKDRHPGHAHYNFGLKILPRCIHALTSEVAKTKLDFSPPSLVSNVPKGLKMYSRFQTKQP